MATLAIPQSIPPVGGGGSGAAVIFPQMTVGPVGNQIVFNSGITDVNGVGWIVNQIDGWDYPPLRETSTVRSHDHGVWMDPAFYNARLVTLHGAFASLSPAALMVAREQLHAATNVTDRLIPFTVNETPPKMVMVRRGSGCKDSPLAATIFQFQVGLYAPDPRKYDPTQTLATTGQPISGGGAQWPLQWPVAWGTSGAGGGTLTITNNGTIASRPVLTINGPCINPSVSNGTQGKTLAFAITLLAGDQLVIDLSTRSVVLNGTAGRRGTITSTPDQWWDLQPGVNQIGFVTGDSGNTGATLSVSYASAWI